MHMFMRRNAISRSQTPRVLQYSMILDVDMEGNTWRKIDRPSGLQHSMYQAQGHLCVCTIAGPNDSKLSIWILEDYGTNNWTLKHMVSTWILFERINIRFGFMDWVDEYTVIIVHLEWNMIFFVGEQRTIIAYDLNHRKVNVIPALVIRYHRCRVMKEDMSRPYYIPYVPLFFFLESLAE